MDPSQLKQAFYFSDPVPLFLVYTAFYFSDPVHCFWTWYRITSVISNACASSVQATFCLLLLDNKALTPKAATIRSTDLLCGGYPCCKRSARASR